MRRRGQRRGSSLLSVLVFLDLLALVIWQKNLVQGFVMDTLLGKKKIVRPMTTTTSLHQETASSSSTDTAAATNPAAAASIPNWRVLKLDEKHASSRSHHLLQERHPWSDENFRGALALYHRLTSCTDSFVRGHIEASLNCIDHAYRLYGPDSVVCSFNGGKDAVVILHLLRAALANYHYQQQQQHCNNGENENKLLVLPPLPRRPRVIYFEHDDEFPEMLEFLDETVRQYDLDMIAFERGVKFPQGLTALVEHNNYPVVASSNNNNNNNNGQDNGSTTAAVPAVVRFPLSFVLGTRTGDPNAGQQGYFAPSSHYMPPFMRINPILDWTYGHVWHFLRLFQLPYCSLYDRGYTSLGTTKDTLPCPALAVAGGGTQSGTSCTSSIPKYWPAYMLRDWDQERAGRIPKDKMSTSSSTKSKKTTATTKAPPASAAAASASAPVEDAAEDRGNLYLLSRANSSMSVVSEVRFADDDVVSIHEKQRLRREQSMSVLAQDADSCLSYSDDQETQKTVGLLIIGDEILKGYTADTNTQAAAQALREQNVLLRRVVVVSDDQDEIVNEIGRLHQEVDVIITSGGVGPTHDDVTIKSVAAALRCDLVLHEEMVQLLRDKMNDGDTEAELTEAQIKMATLPSFSKLRYLSENPQKEWPVLQCRNIFILPGIPEFFSAKIENVAKYLSCQLERGTTYKVVLSVDENSIVSTLNQVVENHPCVCFGSYPFVSHPDFKTVITVEGRLLTTKGRSNSTVFDRDMIDTSKQAMDKSVELALEELITTLPTGSVLRVDNDDMLLYS